MPETSQNSNLSTRKKGAPAVAIGLGIFLSRIAGLVRQRVFAHYLGNSDAAGAFTAALRIPNLLQNLFGEGVLSASFVPVYARLLAEDKKEEAGKVAGVVFSLLAMLVGVLTSLGVLLAPQMINVLAPGFQGDVREKTVYLVQVMFPGMGLLVLSAWCLGVLNSHRKFFICYVAPVLWNVAMIAVLFAGGMRVSSDRAGQMELVVWVGWGTVIGAVMQILAQLPWALKMNEGLRFSLDTTFAPVRTVVKNFFPALLSRGVVQISAYIDQVLASFLGPQAVAAMAYAQTLSILPVSLFGISISSAELTEMSRSTGNGEQILAAIKVRLVSGLERIAFFIIPCSAAFVFLGGVIAATIFQTGKFGGNDAHLVWAILIGSTVGLFASTQSRLCVSAFWALHDAKTPARFAFLRVSLNALLGFLVVFPLRDHFGWPPVYSIAGLTAASGAAGWFEFLLVRRALFKRLGTFGVSYIALTRLWGTAVFAGISAYGLNYLLPQDHPFIYGTLVIAVYGVLYLGSNYLFQAPEAIEVVSWIQRKLPRS